MRRQINKTNIHIARLSFKSMPKVHHFDGVNSTQCRVERNKETNFISNEKL